MPWVQQPHLFVGTPVFREIRASQPWAPRSPPASLSQEMEKQPYVTQLDKMNRTGFDFPPSSTMTDPELSAKLTALIEHLAKMYFFISNTNHLSDRELYDWLRNDGLKEQVPDTSFGPNSCYQLDVLGSYGEEEMELYNKYYATPERRERDMQRYPEMKMPAHIDPPYDRDRTLPVWVPQPMDEDVDWDSLSLPESEEFEPPEADE